MLCVQSLATEGRSPLPLSMSIPPADTELSSGNSSPLSLSPTKDARGSKREKSHERHLQHPAFSDVVSGASRRARREAGMRQNQPAQAPRNMSVLPEGATSPVLLAGTKPPTSLVHPAFGVDPMTCSRSP